MSILSFVLLPLQHPIRAFQTVSRNSSITIATTATPSSIIDLVPAHDRCGRGIPESAPPSTSRSNHNHGHLMRSLFSAAASALLLALALPSSNHAVLAIPDASSKLKTPLPFPIESHPFQLNQELFAANEPVIAGLSAAATAAAPNNNANVSADLSGKRLADVPFPTGAFWTNLVLEKGESIVTTLPYAFRLLQGKVHVSYPFRVVMPKIIQNGFISQMVLSSASASKDDGHANAPLDHQVVGFDSFSTTVRFSRNKQEEFSLFLVRGSPYVTVEYTNSIPTIEGFEGLTVTRIKKLEDQIYMTGDKIDFAVFTVMLSNGQTWSVYASDPALELELGSDGKISSDNPFTGVLRVAVSLDFNVQPFLLEAAPYYPVGGDVDYTIDAATNVASLQFKWKTRRFATSSSGSKESDAAASEKLLMLALPHHMDILANDNEKNATVNTVDSNIRYTSIKGMMLGVYGDVWHLQETLPDVVWDFADDGLFFEDESKDASKKEAALRKNTRDAVIKDIIAQLHKDVDAYPALAVDSYNFGKQIGREARLLLIADRFKQQEVVSKLLSKMKTELGAWLMATNPDFLIYDQTYGGVVTSDGIQDQGADYGNGHYNDHHFHYGYFVYALAAVRKFDPAFITSHSLACAMLVGDIGTPVLSDTVFFDDFPAQQFFPVARHKEWFVGHSYASGLFSMEVGKSQESSSECVNAYYALALFSSLDADAGAANSYHQYARLLLASEMRSTKKYWHMQKNSQIYEPLFSQNTMVGVAGEMSVVYSTWFGYKAVYIHGINMIPFTPITTQLLNEEFVAYEYALLRQDYQDLEPNDIWRSVVVLDHAIVDAATAWDELVTSVNAYDTWNSATNSMYWIATRQSWFAQKTRSTLTHPDLHGEDQCFGYPACNVAGANGTALGCCGALPGCCPSTLGCCPQKDPSSVPLNACFGEHQCAMLGLGCCNSIDGCCEPDPFTGAVLGCCKNQHPVTKKPRATAAHNTTGSAMCYSEPKCAAAKLGCCDQPGGCCAADGPKLDCCSNKVTLAPANAEDTATCQNQPKCAAAKLDCCGVVGGCCAPDPKSSAVLDCCEAPAPTTTLVKSSSFSDKDTCYGEPQCALAGLDCCGSPEGCCQPDPVSGEKLLCCKQDAKDATSAPTPAVPDYVHTCHGEIACLTGGANGTALNCCFTEEGCCPGLLCCASSGDDSGETRTKTGASSDGDSSNEKSTVNLVFAIILGVFILGAIVFCLAMCYRRRHYAPIGHDLRAWYCAGLLVVVFVFFVAVVYNA